MNFEFVTKKEYEQTIKTKKLFCGVCDTPLGIMNIVFCDKYIYSISFGEEIENIFFNLQNDEKNANILLLKVFKDDTKDLIAFVKASDFEQKVYKSLLKIKKGELKSYSDIAKDIGNEKAIRAVGTAIGKNQIAYLIPCHRVISKNGGLGGFSFGLEIKKRILEYEKAKFK